jgi:hypothetical protein
VGPLVIDPNDPVHLEILRAFQPSNVPSDQQSEPVAIHHSRSQLTAQSTTKTG